jgi:hypothetical protein
MAPGAELLLFTAEFFPILSSEMRKNYLAAASQKNWDHCRYLFSTTYHSHLVSREPIQATITPRHVPDVNISSLESQPRWNNSSVGFGPCYGLAKRNKDENSHAIW